MNETAARCEICNRTNCYRASFPDSSWAGGKSDCYRIGAERLKAENASLLESLRAAEAREEAQGLNVIRQGDRAFAAEQRAEAAEKRAADMMEVLRLTHPYVAESDPHMTVDGISRDAVLDKIAALHDEERSAPTQTEKK